VLQVPVRGDEALTETVALLSAEGIAVTELALKLPGLDEVFAALTGAPATSDDEKEAA
jgi:oleandomycin transport system ATP-binding protein